jgi:GNAT superfamily N-acetyltransferase
VDGLTIRLFVTADARRVRALFIAVNRALAPPHLRDAFEDYIVRSLAAEIDRIAEYYGGARSGFWVAEQAGEIVGMFGLEPAGDDALELRRMYVNPASRRRGIARRMLAAAEHEARQRGAVRLELSTSELQQEALALYRGAGYVLIREEAVREPSNKTLGGGIRRFYFAKHLQVVERVDPPSPLV